VSKVWKDGTVLAAAMTPVVVSLVKEMLQRPMESEVVRRSASAIGQPARRVLTTAGPRTESVRERSATPVPPPPRTSNGNGHTPPSQDLTPGDVVLSHPRRTYGGRSGSRLKRVHFKLAIVTGLLAFLVAAVVLTVPELVFGGAVGSKHRTTFFGGDAKSQSEQKKDESNDGSQDSSQPEANPQPSGEDGQSEPAPAETEPAPDEPAPEEPPSSGGTPAPQAPAAPSTP
jgi:hypothetical protein